MSRHLLYLGLDPSHYSTVAKITHWPIIQIVPRPLNNDLSQTLANFSHYSHIVITSKSSVAILKDYLPRVGIEMEIWAKSQTIAVGKVTASHLMACGIKPMRVAQEETAEGVIHELKQLSLEKAHVFWPHSAEARPVIKNFFVRQNIRHTTCVLYEPQPCLMDAHPDLEQFDEIVFTSPSTVKAFLHFFGTFPSHAKLTPIGPITAQFLDKSRS